MMTSEDGWGHIEGRRVNSLLLAQVESVPEALIIRISLEGVRRTDATFPRESVCELARRFRGDKLFCLIDIEDADLLENWDAAALKREQPLIAWLKDGTYKVLGVPASEGNRPLLEMVIASNGSTVGEVAQQTGQSLSNVSNKMKSLWNSGYIMRRERVAETGGVEFVYFAGK